MKKISEEELANLIRVNQKLTLLLSGGVNNWQGWDYSLNDLAKSQIGMTYSKFAEQDNSILTKNYENV